MNEATLMMALRLVHIVTGILWVGATFFFAMYLAPAMLAMGPAGGRVMQELMKRRLSLFMATMPGLVLISGFAMYGRLSVVTHGEFARSHSGMALGLGAVLAIIGGIIDGAVTGRTALALEKLGGILSSVGPPSTDQLKELARLQQKLVSSGRSSSAFLIAAVALMAVARYL